MKPREVDRLLDQTATLRRGTGLDRAGNPTGKTSVEIRCRIERKQRRVVSVFASAATAQFGEEVMSDTTLVTMTEVLPTDAVILPGETRERAILAIEWAGTPDRRGPSLYQVAL